MRGGAGKGSPWSSLENTKYTLLSPKGIKTIYALVPRPGLELLYCRVKHSLKSEKCTRHNVLQRSLYRCITASTEVLISKQCAMFTEHLVMLSGREQRN